MDGDSGSQQPNEEHQLFEPDQVIRPSVMPTSTPAPQASAPVTATPVIMPTEPPLVAAAQPAVLPQIAPAPTETPALQPELPAQMQVPENDEIVDEAYDEGPITWTASEFIANQKSFSWYAALSLAAVIVAVIVWLLTRDFFPTIAVLIGVMLLGIYAGRQPREETYQLDDQGITIGGRHFAYHEFRSFAVVPDGAFLSIELAPLKRFALDTTIYVDPESEDRILDHLSQYLPMEEAKANFTDSLMRRIKF